MPSLRNALSPERECLDPDLLTALEDLAVREKVSVWELFLAAFECLVFRYTRGETEIASRVLIGGERKSHAPERLFSMTTGLRSGMSVSTAIQGVAREVRRAEGVPSLNEAFRGANRVHTLIAIWQPQETAGLVAHSADLRMECGVSPAVWVSVSAGAILGNSEPILRASEHFRVLLHSLSKASPQTPIDHLELLTEEERRCLVEAWSGSEQRDENVRDLCLHRLFEETVAAHPSRTAIRFDGYEISYEELDRRANQLSHYLKGMGVGPGDFVGVLLPRGPSLYMALLASLKAGAAYVPLDSEYPLDRIQYILSDCDTKCLLTDSALGISEQVSCEVVCLDRLGRELAALPRSRPPEIAQPGDLAYVIYTSGTTGRPKGVPISHRAVAQLVQIERNLFHVGPEDRVYQGFSIAFDASVEEIWLAFGAGAALVPGTREMARSGPGLSRLLAEQGVTILDTVPTQLAMLDEDIPSVRLLILGGETCTTDLVARWARPGRQLLNTYGPTEATVIATFAECEPTKPVTIGRPLPNYQVYVLDQAMQPAPIGVPGELHIAGDGLSPGYLNQPELSAKYFVQHALVGRVVTRLYKTGDLVRFNRRGELEFLGRIDTQVKLRGFRIELSEIEEALRQVCNVRACTVALREDTAGIQRLVAYVVPHRRAELDEALVKARLRQRLASYMVPSFIEPLEELPTLPSGKVDRRRLPPPRPRASEGRKASPPQTELEKKIALVWGKLFHPLPVSIEDDFFELGGHSLLAARLISELRKDPEMRGLSVSDLYAARTLEKLARVLATKRMSLQEEVDEESPAPFARFTALSGLLQAAGISFVLSVASNYLLFPWLAYRVLVQAATPLPALFVGSFAGILGAMVTTALITIAAKWLIIGRYRESSHPLWGTYYWRFWLVRRLQGLVPLAYLRGTPLLAWFYRAMGARIGAGVYLGSPNLHAFDLIQIGDGASIGMDAELLGYSVEKGRLRFGRIAVGAQAFVGARAVIAPGATVGAGGALDDMSLLPTGGAIPHGEHWRGSPALPVPRKAGEPSGESNPWSFLSGVGFAIAWVALGLVPLVAVVPSLSGFRALERLAGWPAAVLSLPWLVALSVLAVCLQIAGLKWALLGQVRPGRYALGSVFYFRKWLVDALMQMSLELLHSLYATLYLPPWFRLMGAKLGRRVEISTASHLSPDLLSVDRESFVADSASLGAPHVRGGFLTVAPVRIGVRSFVGNSAFLPLNARLGDGALLGCLSVPPLESDRAAASGTSWLGSPAFFLPRRQKSSVFPSRSTFRPSRALYFLRAAIEFFRVTLPGTIGWMVLMGIFAASSSLRDHFGFGVSLVFFPAVSFLGATTACFAVVALKWLLVGRYRPLERPLWSHFVWRNELVTALHECVAAPLLLNALQGTTLLAWYFRAMGARIGREVYLETTQLTEFDLARIDDQAALNLNCTVQTHLFEDRVMKMSHLHIGRQCSVGSFSVVLYDSEMGERSSLGSLSLLMKGESLPAGTYWEGSPARPVSRFPQALAGRVK